MRKTQEFVLFHDHMPTHSDNAAVFCTKMLDLEAMTSFMNQLNIMLRSVIGFGVDDAQKTFAALLLWSALVVGSGREVWDRDGKVYDEGMYGEAHGTRSVFIMLVTMIVTSVKGVLLHLLAVCEKESLYCGVAHDRAQPDEGR